MAEVFKAQAWGAQGDDEIVALKRLLPHAEERPELVASFVDEAELAAQLHHPHVARVYELGRARGGLFLTMEFIEGRDLRRVMRAIVGGDRCDDPRAEPALVAAIGAQVADALAYVHGFVDPSGLALRIVHRDVSPQNLMVERSGRVKLVDFGIACFEGRVERTDSGLVKGKRGYMSPEQVRGEPLDGRSDLFSLGVLLWELLVGRRLFRGESLIDSLALTEAAVVPPLAEVAPDVPTALADWVTRCLARDRTDRPRDAATLGRGLARALRVIGECGAEGDGCPEEVVARGYAALFPNDAELAGEVTLDEYRQALYAVELGEDPGLVGRDASDITVVPDTADLRAYLERARARLAPRPAPRPRRPPIGADRAQTPEWPERPSSEEE